VTVEVLGVVGLLEIRRAGRAPPTIHEIETRVAGPIHALAPRGQWVAAGEPIARVGAGPLEAPVAGRLVEWLVDSGTRVQVGQPVVVIEEGSVPTTTGGGRDA
jgi:multidrug efflux pump subunit AcrA (membrane-fusion protein)